MRIGLRVDAATNNHFMYMQASLMNRVMLPLVSVIRGPRLKLCKRSNWQKRQGDDSSVDA